MRKSVSMCMYDVCMCEIKAYRLKNLSITVCKCGNVITAPKYTMWQQLRDLIKCLIVIHFVSRR